MTEILVTDIVSDSIEGEAIFDKLMQAIELRLEDQFKKQRITGTDYATVYLGALQGALQQSIAFALGKEQAGKQADLTAEQVLLTTEQVLKTSADTSEVIATTVRNDNLATSNINKIDTDILETAASTIRNDNLSVVSIAKTTAETVETTASTLRNDNISASTITKLTSEIGLLDQKGLTEQAQILDNINGNPVVGLIGQQKDLYAEQTKGFMRQAEQKALKGFVDVWAIAKNATPNADALALPLNVDQSSMDVMLAKVAKGIGVEKTDLGTQSVQP